MNNNNMSLGQSAATPGADRLRNNLTETQLEILYQVSQVLSRSLRLSGTLKEVLSLLHDLGGYHNSFIVLADDETGAMTLQVTHQEVPMPKDPVSYEPGEGILGGVLESGDTVMIPRLGDEPNFLDRLHAMDPDMPFVASPIVGAHDAVIGIIAAQPPEDRALLGDRTRFLKMVANLISQTVRLYQEVQTEQEEIREERDSLRRKVKAEHGFDNIVGRSKVMRENFERVRLVAKWNTTVLVRGESGTGKELIASAIHYQSPRTQAPFVKLNCAAIPDNLLESELFGHEKGSFTGATGTRKGRFELADMGTLFLDEIGEISGAFQAKLLRVLQEGEFERVGGSKTLKVDVRIIAATNRDLEDAVERGDFREDLYYRLNVMPIYMPPLRDRTEDIPDLAQFLVQKVSKAQGRPLDISESAIRMLTRHSWPGNVRELENCIERAAIMSENNMIDDGAIELTGIGSTVPSMPSLGIAPAAPSAGPSKDDYRDLSAGSGEVDLNDPDLSERDRVVAALEKAGWVQAKAARLLNMTPRQIAYRIQTLNIDVRQF